MAKKNVTYRVFIIKNEELTHDATDLKDVLRTKLANSNVERRLIPVKEGDDSEKDLLGAFAPVSNVEDAEYVYGVMMRLKPAKEFRALPDNFEQLVELPETDLLELQEVEGKTICSSLYHFMIRGKYLITDLPQIQTITGFQKYLSKLLVNRTYGFAPYLMRKDLKLKDISTVTFKDPLRPTPQDEGENMFSLKKIVKGAIKFIGPEVKKWSEIMDSNMVSAHMVLNFERPKKMEPEVYAKKLGAILAPIQDLDCVFFTLNNGMKLLGSDLVFTHKETLEDDVITPMTYIRREFPPHP
jgi:hypothetical protein